jgi:diguanylate cyclase (GGDEF)-like protein/PAS domain S-box-containing protein
MPFSDERAGPPRPPEGAAAPRPLPAELEARALVEQLPAILYVSEAGVDGSWHYVSPGVWDVLGFTPDEWMADPELWARQVHPDDQARVFGRETERYAPAAPEEYRMRHRDGKTVWVRDEAALVIDAKGRERWHGVMLDITDRKLAEAELERRAEQQAAVARLGERALEGDEVSELIHSVLGEATAMLGKQAGAVLQCGDGDGDALTLVAGSVASAGEHCQADEGEPDRERKLGADEVPAGQTWPIEGLHGRWGLIWLPIDSEPLVAADSDFVQALANTLADAIARRAAEDDIRHQALHDPLTGLPNRVLFLDRLAHALSRRTGDVVVVLLDIDNFKLVNDSLGHEAGDELLIKIAPRLVSAMRPGDTVARLGGDEFVVLIEGLADPAGVTMIAERIISALQVPFKLAAGEHFATASLGIAIAGPEAKRPASLIRDADAAMYEAKSRGPGRFEVFNREMRTRSVERLSVENDLRRALEREELQVVYQPIVSLSDLSVVAAEALVRWQHPARGLVSPAEFIPVAEESGLIEPVGSWVLNAACAQASLWHEAHPDSRPVGICVNMSARQLIRADLEATVVRALELTGIEPASLTIEITESLLLQEPQGVLATITRVARLGVRFVLDDFGTGYSSLAYLAQLPIAGLKVDRSFVAALGRDERSTAITTAIVGMAHALAVEVTAEGIESEDQLAALRELGCGLGQGFYLHRPLPAQAMAGLLDGEPAPAAARDHHGA